MQKLLNTLTANWWGILIICVIVLALWIALSAIFYKCFFKRFYDILLSGIAIIVLSPIFLLLVVLGAIKMKGNPFFAQLRPGKNEKIFKLVKFRTMTCETDESGNLLPDEKRLTKYGKFLRSTSLDEIPELFNIFIGNMSIVGPRPLVPQYLPYYTDIEKNRHNVRPGLTGLAQVRGRNALQWEERFAMDVEYVNNIALVNDVKILFLTVKKVLTRDSVGVRGTGKIMDFDKYRKLQIEQIEKQFEENSLI